MEAYLLRRHVGIDIDRHVHPFGARQTAGGLEAIEQALRCAAGGGFDQRVPAVLVFQQRHAGGGPDVDGPPPHPVG